MGIHIYKKIKKLTPEVKLILDIVKGIIENKAILSINSDNVKKINWHLVEQMLVYHELTPFAYIYFNSSSLILPKELMNFLKKTYYFSLFKNIYLQKEFLKINQVFMKENLPIVPIKGVALLGDIYEYCTIRPMVDMDVLVKEEDLEKAENILIKLGYNEYLQSGNKLYWRNKNCNIPFKKNGQKSLLLELHFALDLKRLDRNILPDLWERLGPLKIQGQEVKSLSPEDTLFSLALHQRRFGRRLCLKNTLDIALLINKYKDSFNWDYVLKEAKEDKMCSVIFFVLFQANVLLDTSIPQTVWRNLKIPAWKKKLVYQFIKKDTFSPKSINKIKHTYLKSHFLLYDSLWEPIHHILNVTPEEFAKFYNLPLYTPETEKLYKSRFLYMPYKLIKESLKS